MQRMNTRDAIAILISGVLLGCWMYFSMGTAGAVSCDYPQMRIRLVSILSSDGIPAAVDSEAVQLWPEEAVVDSGGFYVEEGGSFDFSYR
jgi:hypothetical protein